MWKTRWNPKATLALALLLLCGGCADSDRLASLQNEVTALKKEVLALKKEVLTKKTPGKAPDPAPAVRGAAELKIGQTVNVGDLDVTFVGVRLDYTTNKYVGRSKEKMMLIDLKIKNTSKGRVAVPGATSKWVEDNFGNKMEVETMRQGEISGELRPGKILSGFRAFKKPKVNNATDFHATFEFDWANRKYGVQRKLKFQAADIK